jgi:hypothetical protein
MSQPQDSQYAKASVATAASLKTIAQALLAEDLTPLSLPEVEQTADMVAKIVPAGNVSGMILNGLARLTARRPSPQMVKRDVGLLFKGVEQILDQAVYGALFAGPAAVLWGYQKLMTLAGKSPEDAFPNGTWQFYVDYALREDTARHTNETHGFDTLLALHHLKLDRVDRTAAWVMTAIDALHNYPALLENEWRERVHTRVANEVSGGRLPKLYSQWERQRPYGRRSDAGDKTYVAYRRAKFDRFMHEALQPLSLAEQAAWRQRVAQLEAEDLPRYQQQMTLCSYLQPDQHSETHMPLDMRDTHIGLIHNEMYYLIPACKRGTSQPPDVMTVRAQVAAVMYDRLTGDDAYLTRLATIKRSAFAGLVGQLNPVAQEALMWLRTAPILINTDQRPHHLMLSEIRQSERGIGDHALTLFDTGKTIVFDQSHIYFDGAWGAAFAEILTNEALSWARYLSMIDLPATPHPAGVRPLRFRWQQADDAKIDQAPRIVPESSAETDQINLKSIVNLRAVFKQRSDLLQLTVNDLLVLYRAIHAQTYRPAPELVADLRALLPDPRLRPAVQAALDALEDLDNPAILIPIDASTSAPSERLYPMSFTVPLNDLDLIEMHVQTMAALKAYQTSTGGDRAALYLRFDELQREYLASLAGFGAVLSRAKDIALSGESVGSSAIRLLAHLPRPLQRLLDGLPSRVDLLNDIIKGREVFSNIGAVVPTSTLTRFITAKDDNEKKTLVWGVITDARQTMRVSLRDFRPHVRQLSAVGLANLAQRITHHYLSTYAQRLNAYINDLRYITLASRETRMTGQAPS